MHWLRQWFLLAWIGVMIGLSSSLVSAQVAVSRPLQTGNPPPASAQTQSPVNRAEWAARLSKMDFTQGGDYQAIQSLAGMQGEAGFQIVQENWNNIAHEQVKANLIYLFANNAHAYDILKLGALDASAEVQSAAFAMLTNYAFHNFAGDASGYRTWLEDNKGKSLEEIVRSNESAFIARMKAAQGSDRAELARQLTTVDFTSENPLSRLRRQLALDLGVPELLAEYLPPTLGDNPPMSAWWTLQLLEALQPDTPFVRKVIVPLVNSSVPQQMRIRLLGIIATHKEPWASDVLVTLLLDHYPDQLSLVCALYLPPILDPHSIPLVIGLLQSDSTGETNSFVGRILHDITRVEPDAAHGGDWWAMWWEKNKASLPGGVQGMHIPRLRPIEEVIQERARAFVSRLLSAPDALKVSGLLQELQTELQWGSFGGYYGGLRSRRSMISGTAPLLNMRLSALKEAGLPQALAKYVTVEAAGHAGQTFWQAMQVIARMQPDEPFSRQVLLPLTEKTVNMQARSQAVMALANPGNKWAEPALLKMFVQEYPDQGVWPIAQALGAIGDPHAIPTLIGVLESYDTDMAANVIGQALLPLTGLSVDQAQNVDADWWHGWWLKNKSKFPGDVRSLPIPKLALHTGLKTDGFHIRLKAVYHQIGDDPRRAFWLMTPGYVSAPSTHLSAMPGGNRQSPLGLIVVLGSGFGDDKAITDFWLDATQKAFGGHYLVALALPPRGGAEKTSTWAIKLPHSIQVDKSYTAEALSADIVKEVCSRFPIHPDRIFLHGAGDAGLAVYACSLERDTPFKGFYLSGAPFHSAELPALSEAKGRSYFLHHSREDKTTGFWLAEAARKMLMQKGAKVKLSEVKGRPDNSSSGDKWVPFSEAIGWLENPK